MTVYKYKPSGVSASAGYWAGNTLNIIGALCQQIYVKATTSTTVFDVIITDPKSVQVRKFTNITGTLNDLTPWPAVGIHTVEIDNATVDEAFTVLLSFMERD